MSCTLSEQTPPVVTGNIAVCFERRRDGWTQKSSSTQNSDHPLDVISLSFLTLSMNAAWWEGSSARHEMRCQYRIRTMHSVAWFTSCLFYFAAGCSELVWGGDTEASDMYMWLTAAPTLVGNCGLQNGCKTLCSSWVSSLQPCCGAAALEQLKVHQATTGLRSEEALRAPEVGSNHPSGHARRLLKGMTVLKAFLIIHRNIVIPHKASG